MSLEKEPPQPAPESGRPPQAETGGDTDPESYDAFWPQYLAEHRNPTNRALHYAGTGLGLLLLLIAVVTANAWMALAAVGLGYGLAWSGHFFVERNRPKSFSHPFWSLFSDLRMLALWLTSRLDEEMQRQGFE